MRLVLLGPPGTGKGTQGKMLEKELKLPHVSTGDILRETVKKPTSLARRTAKYLRRGELVPDETVTEIIKNRLKRKTNFGFILDGFPRNISQAKILDNLLKEKCISLDRVIYLDAKEKTLIERLSGRRVCFNCQAVFHLENSPPQRDLICDCCGGRLIQRDDDKKETIKKRFHEYQKKTKSLIDYYRRKKILVRIPANGDKETVLKRILMKIKSSNQKPEHRNQKNLFL